MLQKMLRTIWGISLFLLGAMGAIVFVDIILRYVFRHSLPWGVEVCEYILFAITYLAAPWLLLEDKHVKIEILNSWLRPDTLNILDGLHKIVLAIFCLFAAVASLVATVQCYKTGLKVTKIYSVDKFYFMALISFSFILMAVTSLALLSRSRKVAREQ